MATLELLMFVQTYQVI